MSPNEEVKNYYSCSYRYEPLPREYYMYFLELLGVEQGKKLLDIACGQGELLQVAQEKALMCYGVDISDKAVQIAKHKVQGEITVADVEIGLDYPDCCFDYITCLGSLEHFRDQAGVLHEMGRVAKENVKICIHVPNEHYILHEVGLETDTQPVVNRHSLKGWTALLQSNGFHILRVLKDNRHLASLGTGSRGLQRLGKTGLRMLLKPFLPLLPTVLSYHFVFICAKKQR